MTEQRALPGSATGKGQKENATQIIPHHVTRPVIAAQTEGTATANNGPSRPYPWRRQFYQEELVLIRELSLTEVAVLHILSLLAWQKGGELPLETRRLASMAQRQHGAIERALRRLHELDIVSMENGNLRIYHIDRELKHASNRSAKGIAAARNRWGAAALEDAG